MREFGQNVHAFSVMSLSTGVRYGAGGSFQNMRRQQEYCEGVLEKLLEKQLDPTVRTTDPNFVKAIQVYATVQKWGDVLGLALREEWLE